VNNGAESPDHRQVGPPTVVFLVDDQRFVALAVQRLLSTEPDIELHFCDSATDAITRANALTPTVILQDLVMPGINGLELVGLFRKNAATARTPIVVLSGNEEPDSRTKALAAGANDYLLKLPGKDELIACIRAHAAGHTRPKESAGPSHSVKTDADACQTLDRDVIAMFCERSGELSSFARSLIAQFTRDAESQISTMTTAVRAHDDALLKSTAHSLKGSSMTVGAKRLGVLCRRLEDDCSTEPDREALVSALEEEFVRLRKAFAAL